MLKKMLLGVLVMIVAVQAASAAILFEEDFFTFGAYNTRPEYVGTDDINGGLALITQDTVEGKIRTYTDTNWTAKGVRLLYEITAPAGMMYENIVVSQHNWATIVSGLNYGYASVAVSGDDWATKVETPATTPNSWHTIYADGSVYDGATTISFYSYAWSQISGSSYGQLGNLRVDGDIVPIPEPMTLTLLAIGGLVSLRRRR
ncbi:MAG: PEP-CTERM sorting domain-containing protein [Sedimentisphaerales bacterium]|nr:PEP-CTERM sorting domain-containing protein [Sedimentisphaerales bacterium]